MREPTVARDRERGLAGVIDTLSAGYNVVNRHPWILVVPVLLDLFYWLGPRLSLAPLVQSSFGSMPVPPGLSPEALQSYQEYRDELLQAGQSFNLFALLASHVPGIPSLMAARDGLGSIFGITDPSAAMGLFLLLPLAGLGLASVYYLMVGRPIRSGEETSREMWGRVWRTWWRLIGFLLLVIGIAMLVGLPLMTFGLLLGAFNSSLFGFAVGLLWVAALWVQFYLFFVVDAVVISDVGPLRAVRNSIAVVRLRFSSALGLIGLTWIITLGMPVVWDALATNPAGIVLGILGNAYISTGLAAASMIYYRDRFAALSNRTD